MTDKVAIRVEHVSKTFRHFSERNQSLKSAVMRGRVSKHRDFAALTDISFDVHRGETFGLIGSNGSGKSTLLRCIARILTPNAGSITVTGRVGALLEVGSGFHAELTGRENVYLAGAIAGLSRKEVARVFDDIVDFSGIEDFIDEPIKNYSSGMYVRLGFSTAVAVRPDVLLADEILAVGDAEFQARCLARIEQMRSEGTTIVLVTHDTAKIERFCGRAAWLNHGQLEIVDSAVTVAEKYLHSLGPGSEEV
jgi:ABC-2 type transport system ATP-binding protein